MTISINDFIANFRGGARPNKYRVAITWPAASGTPNVQDQFFILSASLPSSVMAPVIVPFMGRQIPVPGDRIFEDWTVTVLNDTSFSHRNSFERWMNAMNGHIDNLAHSSNYKDFLATMEVTQLDRDESVLKVVTIHNAFPTNVSQIDLGMADNDVVEQFSVTFSLSHWESVQTTS